MNLEPIKYGQVWRNKNTGKTVFIQDEVANFSTSGSRHSDVVVLDDKGQKQMAINSKDFRKDYEKVDFDINRLLPSLLQYLSNTNTSIYRSLEVIARRLHPGGYFQVGCIVFIISPLFLCETDLRYGQTCEKPYEIINIYPSVDVPLLNFLVLESKYYQKDTIEVPMYHDRISEVDAYSCLRRYDLPY